MQEDEAAGRLTTESLEERRARLIAPPRIARRSSALSWLLLLLVLVVPVAFWLGAIPGSALFGR